MEVDFDKEIDTLLRKAQRDAPVYVGDFASGHLDADAISAFAENAMPEKTRALYLGHLADCDRCREILSNVLVMNAEAAPAADVPSAITIAERDLPWYRKLFLFPNLAYVMGSLVLVFGGFLAFTIVRSSMTGDMATVSQITPTESTKDGPNFQDEPAFPVAGLTNSSANSAANSVAVAANTNAGMARGNESASGIAGPRANDSNFAADGSSADTAIASPPPPPVSVAAAEAQPAPKDARERDDAKAKLEDKVAGGSIAQEKPSSNLSPMRKESSPGSPVQSGPMRNSENQYNRQMENLDRSSAAKKAARDALREEESSSGLRSVGGKTFERKQGVWYDTTFQGRPTINVRRGTAEFNRLDGGLRSIANSLNGTVVIVWGAKAYRVQ